MKKPTGRKPNFSRSIMRIIGEKAASGEFTLRETSRIYRTSHGTVSVCKKLFGKGTPRSLMHLQLAKFASPIAAEKTAMELELKRLIDEIWKLDEEIEGLQKYHK